MRFSATPVRADRRMPLTGEHTDAVLTDWLGYSGERLKALADAGVTKTP